MVSTRNPPPRPSPITSPTRVRWVLFLIEYLFAGTIVYPYRNWKKTFGSRSALEEGFFQMLSNLSPLGYTKLYGVKTRAAAPDRSPTWSFGHRVSCTYKNVKQVAIYLEVVCGGVRMSILGEVTVSILSSVPVNMYQ